MRELQQQIIDEMGVKPAIDPAAEVEARVQFLVDYLEATGASGYVLGISGGVDSTAAGRLAQLAVERVVQRDGNRVPGQVLEVLPGPGTEVHLDLDGVSYLASAGVGMLVDLVRRAAERSVRLELGAGPGTPAARVLALTGISRGAS